MSIAEQEHYREEIILESKQGSTVTVNGKETVMLAANNYLGLANHPRIIAAAHRAIDTYGYGMASVPILSGTQIIHKQLEERIAKFIGCEQALLFPSCFMANTGVFHAMLKRPGPTNYVDTIYNDANNHPSVEYGVKLAMAYLDKVRHVTYRNNDIAHLTTLLESSPTGHGRISFIITSGMFYSEGNLTQLDGLLKLRDKYKAILYLDDSHGIGVLGATGRGIAEEQGFLGKPDLIAGTFGKALGGACGGFIAGKTDTIEYLRQNAVTYINSNALPPPVVCAAIEAINILEEDSSLVNKLRDNTSYFRSELKNLGFNISASFHPTILILIGEEALAKLASQELLNNGVYCREISYPLVAKGAARLRLQISASHTRQELDKALEAIATVGQRLKLLT